MFVYVWVGLGFFLSLLTSSYDAMNSLETRPSPSSTRACSVSYNYAWEYLLPPKILPRVIITYGACARGGGRRPGFEAS